MNIQRYDIHEFGITPHFQGRWMKAEDVDKLEKENAALVANMDEMIHDLYGSNEVVATYWDEKTLHLRKKEGGKE